jgi:hypothetical protein
LAIPFLFFIIEYIKGLLDNPCLIQNPPIAIDCRLYLFTYLHKSIVAMRFAPLITCLAAVSLAAPTNFLDDAYKWTNELAEFYGKVSQYIDTAKHDIKAPAACDVSKIALPAYASGMTSPSDLKPRYVALGRGTQVTRSLLDIFHELPN